MLRFAVALLAAVIAGGTAEGADRAIPHQAGHHGWHRAAVMLPAGLPRRHYDFRTTISYSAPSSYRRPVPQLSVYEAPDQLYAPTYVALPYVQRWPVAGYYGSPYTWQYQGPYYGGPYFPYWERLPYACGVYGYC